MNKKWDEGEHEGCGVDSERAYKQEKLVAAINEAADLMKLHDETVKILNDWIDGPSDDVGTGKQP